MDPGRGNDGPGLKTMDPGWGGDDGFRPGR